MLLFISAIMNISWLWNCLIPFATISRTSELIHFYKCINCLLPNCVCGPQGNPHVFCDFVPAMLTEIILLNNFTLPSFQQTYVMVKPISFLNQRKIGSQYALESLTVILCPLWASSEYCPLGLLPCDIALSFWGVIFTEIPQAMSIMACCIGYFNTVGR